MHMYTINTELAAENIVNTHQIKQIGHYRKKDSSHPFGVLPFLSWQ